MNVVTALVEMHDNPVPRKMATDPTAKKRKSEGSRGMAWVAHTPAKRKTVVLMVPMVETVSVDNAGQRPKQRKLTGSRRLFRLAF